MEVMPPIESLNKSPVVCEMRITLHENEEVVVTGPLQNKPICYFMLIHAMDAVKAAKAETALGSIDDNKKLVS